MGSYDDFPTTTDAEAHRGSEPRVDVEVPPSHRGVSFRSRGAGPRSPSNALGLVLVMAASAVFPGCFDPTNPVDSFGTTATGSDTSAAGAGLGSDSASTRAEPMADADAEDGSGMGAPRCGDGLVQADEACDDAGESATCDADCTAVECGDGTINAAAGEDCEDGGETERCDADCTAVECGDGTLNLVVGEQCDDAGPSPECDADCTWAECGDGVVNALADESCDDAGPSPECDMDCTLAVCGDGLLNDVADEACDDGNVVAGDGCSPSCSIEVPNACHGDVDPISGDLWVVCSADADEAWVSHALPGGGDYHPELICASLGYASVGAYGGTCGSICGYCRGETSCAANGSPVFDGGGYCGMDPGGLVLCPSVHWQCTNP